MVSLPRLTGSLRAFSDVAAQDGKTTDSKELSKKRLSTAKRSSEHRLVWSSLVTIILSKADAKESDIKGALKQLSHSAYDISESPCYARIMRSRYLTQDIYTCMVSYFQLIDMYTKSQ